MWNMKWKCSFSVFSRRQTKCRSPKWVNSEQGVFYKRLHIREWTQTWNGLECTQRLCTLTLTKFILNIWKFLVHVLLKPHLENFEHYFASVWDECNSAVVWTFFGIAFLWDWNENWSFPLLWPLLSLQNCRHIECSTFTASSLRTCNS